MPRFSDSNSKLGRFLARNDGNLVGGFVREVTFKANRYPAIRRLLRAVVREREPEKWLFIVGCYNSGTTMLRRLLESHEAIGSFSHEGVELTEAFPDLEAGGWPRMMYANRDRWAMPGEGGEALARLARRDWAPFWGRKARVFLEKSIDHTVRIAWMQRHFPNAHFIAITRNGYCVNEGILRRARPAGAAREKVGDSYPPEMLARQWTEFQRLLEEGESTAENYLRVRYEDLIEKPVESLASIFAFLGMPEVPIRREGNSVIVAGVTHELVGQNDASLARLDPELKAAMRPHMRDALAAAGYTP